MAPRPRRKTSPILAQLFELEEALGQHDVPAISDYWRAQITRFYSHPTARVFVGNIGRGGDKTRMSVLMGIAETLAGGHQVAGGERHYFAHVSESVAEAEKTLGVYERYLHFLGVPYDRRGESIDLRDLPMGFRVMAARVGAVSGFRCYGWTADECAKWSDGGVNPTSEVVASMRAMTVTHPTARARMISSPVSSDGYFFDTWSKGDTAGQLTAHAPTWIANPSVSEAFTRTLEEDPRVHAREYGAVASSGVDAAFDADAIERALVPRSLDGATFARPVIVFDWSSGGRDATTWARARKAQLPDGSTLLVLDKIGTMGGAGSRATSATSQADAIATLAKSVGASQAWGDQRESFTLREMLSARGVQFIEHAWSNPTKREAVERVRRLMNDSQLVLEKHEAMRKQLHSFREIITANKSFVYRAAGSGHDDFVSLVLLAVRAEMHGALRPALRGPVGCIVGGNDFESDTSRFRYPGEGGPLGI